MTKGEMVKILKRYGIRRGDKNGANVPLAHLKYEDICKIYDDFEKNFAEDITITYGTGDAEYFSQFVTKEV